MDLNLSTEERELEAAAASLLAREWSTEDARIVYQDTPNGQAATQRLRARITDAGWLGIAFGEDVGGAGGTLFDLGIVFRQFGRYLVPTSISSSLAAALVVDAFASADQRTEYLTPLVSGQSSGTVALSEPRLDAGYDLTATSAKHVASGYEISGNKTFVPDAETADVTVVSARLERGALRLFAMPTPASNGIRYEQNSMTDRAPSADVSLSGVQVPESGLLLGHEDSDESAYLKQLNDAVDRVTILRCLEMVGGAERALEFTAHHVSEREQFGRPIGTFQAVQMHVADMYTAVYSARLACFKALTKVSAEGSAPMLVSIAKSLASYAADLVTVYSHELHGGMGIVTEGSLFLWSRRAETLQARTGRAEHHLDRVADTALA
jgi:alkylation response protein AidB-like acyl-CoA dehydrogenase